MKKLVAPLIALLCLVCSLAVAQNKPGKKATSAETTITGRITDVKCHLNGMAESMGEDHGQCATECIQNGLPVGLFDEKGDKLYLVVPAKGMKPANEELLKYVDQKVRLTGTLREKSGMAMFSYSKIEAAK